MGPTKGDEKMQIKSTTVGKNLATLLAYENGEDLPLDIVFEAASELSDLLDAPMIRVKASRAPYYRIGWSSESSLVKWMATTEEGRVVHIDINLTEDGQLEAERYKEEREVALSMVRRFAEDCYWPSLRSMIRAGGDTWLLQRDDLRELLTEARFGR
jgi:hypothetical protein